MQVARRTHDFSEISSGDGLSGHLRTAYPVDFKGFRPRPKDLCHERHANCTAAPAGQARATPQGDFSQLCGVRHCGTVRHIRTTSQG